MTGELVTAAMMNTHVRDNLKAIGEHQPGDLLPTYVTHANATSTTLTEPRTGWYIANGATFVQASHPTLYANIGSTTTLPDYRGRMFVAPGTQDGHAFARGETGGEYDHALTIAELPVHDHPLTGSPSVGTLALTSNGALTAGTGIASGANLGTTSNPITGAPGVGTLDVGNAGSGTAYNVMSPYRVGGMILIKNDN